MQKIFSLTAAVVAACCILITVTTTIAAAEEQQQQQQVDNKAQATKKCMPFKSITGIAFEPGMTTTRVRTPNVERMRCFGNCPAGVELTGAHCTQAGLSDNGLPSWKCRGSFAQEDGSVRQHRLGNVRVSCEGCAAAGDSDVVVGSCTLRYSIESRARRQRHGMHVVQHSYGGRHPNYGRDSSFSAMDAILITFLVLTMCCCCCAAYARRQREQQQQQWRRGGAGSDQDDFDMGDNKAAHQNQQQGRNGGGAVHHHHHESGGMGGGGFFNGLMMGSLMTMPWGMGGYGYGGGNTTNVFMDGGGDDGGGGFGGDSGWGDGGGMGGGFSD